VDQELVAPWQTIATPESTSLTSFLKIFQLLWSNDVIVIVDATVVFFPTSMFHMLLLLPLLLLLFPLLLSVWLASYIRLKV